MARRPGRVTGKAAKRSKWWMKRRNQWIAGGIAVVVLGAAALTIALDDSSSSSAADSPGDKWKAGIAADFGPMSQGALNYLRVVNDWRTDKVKNPEVDAAADLALTQFLATRDVLAGRAGFDQAPRAIADYKDSIEIYIAHARLAKLGAQLTGADNDQLNHQVQLIMGRLRYVADRLYDLGGDEMAPYTRADSQVDGFSYARAVDVPSFAGTDLAPGPPLALAQPQASQNREYQKVRPETDFASWQAAVEAADIPTVEAETKAISGGTQDELNTLSERLTAASDKLHDSPDPLDERELSTRVQLGLLVQAEAMRTAQVSKLVSGKLRPEAVEIAQVLALLGNGMWDDRLGARDTGYPRTLISDRPAVAPPALPDVVPPDPASPAPGAPDPGAPGAGVPDPAASTQASTEPTTAATP